MNKSVRINLLVITIVVTLFVFAGLWFTRPGVSDDILERARARQREPLMEITEPLRTTSVEEPVDTTQLAREIRRSIEPELTESIRSSLMTDDKFIAEVASKATTSRAFVDAVVPHYDYEAEIDELTARLQQSLSEQLENRDVLYATEAAILIDQAITAQIPYVIDSVLNTLEANKEYIIDIARSELSDLISEDEIVDLYLENRAALVYDIVPMILADMEAIQRGEEVPSKVLAEEAEAARIAAREAAQRAAAEQAAAEQAAIEAEAAVVEPTVPVVPPLAVVEEPVVTVIVEEAVVPPVSVAPRVPAAPAQPTVRVERMVAAVPVVPSVGVEAVIEAPVVEEVVAEEPVERPVITDEVAYEAERQRLRNAEIEKYLKLIGEISE